MRPLLTAIYHRLLPLPGVGSVALALAPAVRRRLTRAPDLSAQILTAHSAALEALRADVDRLAARVAALEARAAAPRDDAP